MAVVVGSIVEGVVTGITHFGAFVQLPSGETGLVHISEIADCFVKDVRDFLKENDKVKVKILSFDGKNKIGLSIKQAKPPSERRQSRASFEEKLMRFMRDSDEKLMDLRRSTDARRGGRGGGRHGW
ncbi:MAG: S1 RNA-binding domain-containing protein [Firmicutes bacterium]|nr:S1 RNA-binding domain-containing protein [Bacillota bacterium]